MERKALHRLLVLTVLVVALVGLNTHPAVAADTDDDQRPRIAPIHTRPQGQTYGRWAAEWFQWALGIPALVNPLTDTTGENCAQRQVDSVWFLAGSVSADAVVRDCEVPAGKSLFFPLINNFYGAFLNDPPETRTEEFVRAAGSCTEPTQISVEIDGFKVPKPTRFFTGASGSQSPFFNVQLPPANLFGADETTIPELVLSPSAEQGYYLFRATAVPRYSHHPVDLLGMRPRAVPGRHVPSHGSWRRPEALSKRSPGRSDALDLVMAHACRIARGKPGSPIE